MFGALKPGFRSLATLKLIMNVSANFKPKSTSAASRGFLATARLSCICTNTVLCAVVLICNIALANSRNTEFQACRGGVL